uniref:Uncharacterized protein n=1 Tax=Anolis carolinensis TaxID=28377 RepID=H9GKA2_ANOCA
WGLGHGITTSNNRKEKIFHLTSPSVPSGPVASDKSGSVTIAVHAKPGSKQNAVTGMLEICCTK